MWHHQWLISRHLILFWIKGNWLKYYGIFCQNKLFVFIWEPYSFWPRSKGFWRYKSKSKVLNIHYVFNIFKIHEILKIKWILLNELFFKQSMNKVFLMLGSKDIWTDDLSTNMAMCICRRSIIIVVHVSHIRNNWNSTHVSIVEFLNCQSVSYYWVAPSWSLNIRSQCYNI